MSFLIKNILVFDGTGSRPFRSDIFINNGKIMALENLSLEPSARHTIDGSDLSAAPGFIDISSASDFWHPFWQHARQSFYLEQGITTVQVGQNGFSLAPLHHSRHTLPSHWSESSLTFDWDSFAEALTTLSSHSFDLNILSGVGILNLENMVKSSFNHRRLSASALKNIRHALTQTLGAGASSASFGFGFRDSHPDNSEDLRQLAKETLKLSPLVSISNHLPDDQARRRLLTLFLQEKRKLKSPAPLLFNGLNFSDLAWFKRSHSLKEINLTISPSGYQLKPLAAWLPPELQGKTSTIILSALKDKTTVTKLMDSFSDLSALDFKIISAPNHPLSVNRHFRDLVSAHGTDPAETLISLFHLTKLKALVLVKDISADFTVSDLINHPEILVTAVADLPDTARTFPRLLKDTLRLNLPLTKTIAALTSRPARLLNLTDRGYLAENLPADLVLFDKTGDLKYVFVNGSLVVKNERHLNIHSGRFITPTPSTYV